MSYYFAIIGTKDNPLFEYEFGTSKHGGDGTSRFREETRQMNQFVLHSSLDIVEEAQWSTGAMYLKCIDRFQNSYIHAFLTPSNMKFLLLHNPDPNGTAISTANSAVPSAPSTSDRRASTIPSSSGSGSAASGTAAVPGNPLSPAAEEAVRNFFTDVYECWCKATMNPFYKVDQELRSPVFRARVAASGRKYL